MYDVQASVYTYYKQTTGKQLNLTLKVTQLSPFIDNNKQQQNKILLITNISNYISFPPQIAYKLIEAGRSKDILQIKSLSIDGLNNRENTTIQYIE